MTILILAVEGDPHAALVEDVLRDKGNAFLRYAYTSFPADSQIGIHVSDNRFCGVISTGGKDYNLNDISAVWHRRPGFPQGSADAERPFREYIESEARTFLDNLEHVTPNAFWLPKPSKEKKAEAKLNQLLTAKEVGLNIPDTVFGNHEQLAAECVSLHQELALKPVDQASIELEPSLSQRLKRAAFEAKRRFFPKKQGADYFPPSIPVLTRRFNRIDAAPFVESVPVCPVILQEYIPKKVELRVTIIGQKVFSCAIRSQESTGDNRTDWRNNVYDCQHEEWPLPEDIAEKCLKLLSRLELHFGCIDMIVTPDNDYIFLENNPNGQWRWIQEMTGMPIAEAIADLLSGTETSQGK